MVIIASGRPRIWGGFYLSFVGVGFNLFGYVDVVILLGMLILGFEVAWLVCASLCLVLG